MSLEGGGLLEKDRGAAGAGGCRGRGEGVQGLFINNLKTCIGFLIEGGEVAKYVFF